MTRSASAGRSAAALMMIVGVGSLFGSTQPVAADGPGMLLYTNVPPGTSAVRKPYMQFKRIGRSSASFGPSAPLPMIQTDGQPFVYATEGSAYLAIPASISGASDVVHTSLGCCVAIDGTGHARAWGPTVPTWMPAAQLKMLEPASNAIGALSVSGELIVWNLSTRINTTPLIGGAQTMSLGTGWGAVVASAGNVQVFSYSGGQPALAPVTAARDVSVAGSQSAVRAAAIRSDGTLVSLTTPFQASGSFAQVVVSAAKLVALTEAGGLHHWTWNATSGEWTSASTIPGAFSEAMTNGNAMFALCSRDADRDGVEDRAQILSGEIADSNGDFVDDRTQPTTILFDDDLNGTPDAAECSGIGTRRKRIPSLWSYNNPASTSIVCFASSGRVPAGAEALRHIELIHTDVADGSYGPPPEGLIADFSIWLDPTNDGDPSDSVRVRSWEVNLEPDGRTSIDLGNLWIGPPGAVFIQMLTYVQSPNKRYAMFAASNMQLPPAGTDLFAASRVRGRTWAQLWNVADAPSDSTAMVRALTSFEEVGINQNIPYWTMNWSDRLPGDCDGDGQLDSLVTGAVDVVFGPDPDADNNGVVDACEQDCDLDGVVDVVEILGGASDCNMDLVPDSCNQTTVDVSQTGPVPGSSNPTALSFTNLPPAGASVLVTVEAVADLGAPTELLIYRFPGQPDLSLFAATGSDCPVTPDAATFELPAAAFNAALTGGALTATLFASALVDPTQCPTGFVRVSFSYTVATVDCDADGILDSCQHGSTVDCNGNGVPDACELPDPALDANANGVLDACEFDCNANGIPDHTELAANPGLDCDGSGFIDACELIDCNGNGVLDTCETLDGTNDCNADGVLDACQQLPDCDSDGRPDACERDCDANGVPDDCDIATGAADKDADGVPDVCEYARGDFNLDGEVAAQDLAYLLSVWGSAGLPVGDLNGDGTIGAQDLTILLGRWGPTGL